MNSEDKMLKFKKFSESVELDEEASNLHTMYSDISESDGDRYGVFSKGGSIGQNSSKPPVKVFSNADEAKAYAKRMRAALSPGERNDYGMSYIVKKVNESVDEASSTSPNMAKAVQGLNDLGYKLKGRDGKDVQRVEKLFRSGNKKVLQGAIRALDTDIRDQIMDILEPLGFVKDGVVEAKQAIVWEENVKKGDSVKIINAKKYDALSKPEVSGIVIGMLGSKVMVKVGSGQMNVDPKDLVKESVELDEGALGKQWQNGAKMVKSGSITLVKAKNPDADLHTVMKNGKKVGTFVFDDGPDAFSVTNMSTKKVSWADQIDDIPKMFESKAPALKSSDYPKGTSQSAQAFKDKFAKNKKESVELGEAFTPKDIKMAIGIASDKRYEGGNMTGAVNAIEKIKKGLSNHSQVKAVLKRQNESLDASTINEAGSSERLALIKKAVLKVRARNAALEKKAAAAARRDMKAKGAQRGMAPLKKDDLDEAKGSKYDVYHKDFSTAVQYARKEVEKQGYKIDDEEWFRKVGSGPRKPSVGKTNQYNIDLMKNDKDVKQKLHMQVYGMDNGKYELNMYVS